MPASNVLLFPAMKRIAIEDCPNRIRYWRLERGLKLTDLAPNVGMTAAHLSNIETGNRAAMMHHFKAIARELEVSVADLLPVEDNPLSVDAETKEILDLLRDSSAEAKQMVRQVAETVAGYRPPPRVIPLDKARKDKARNGKDSG